MEAYKRNWEIRENEDQISIDRKMMKERELKMKLKIVSNMSAYRVPMHRSKKRT